MAVNKIRIGSRGSTLAMWQARFVMSMLEERYPSVEVEIEVVKTTGDINQDIALSMLPGKAFFTKEIEEALLDRRIDLAVHSGKDVPTTLPRGLALAGFLKRHSPEDAWISADGKPLMELPTGAVVGTSSIRRRSLLANLRPDLKIKDLRGNVDTRLGKLDSGQYDAIILATAGLERLGLTDRITERLPISSFPPAVCQGAMAMEIRSEDRELNGMLASLVHPETTTAVTAERALLSTLEGGCQVPLGALATQEQGGAGGFQMGASIIAPDGKLRVDETIAFSADWAAAAGRELAGRLIEKGGARILEQLESL